MSATNLYGPIVTVTQVEQGVAAGIEKWIDAYLGEMERIEGYEPDTIERPRGVISVSEFAKWPEDQLPLILILSPGTESVKKREDGRHEATWLIGVQTIVRDLDQESSRQLAGAYAGAIRAAVVQHKRLKSAAYPEGFGSAVEWVGESYTDIAFNETRTLATARVILSVTVEDVVRRTAGPRIVPPDPSSDPGQWPALVPPVKINVHSEPLDEVFA